MAIFRAKEKKGERGFMAVPYGYVVDPDCNYHLLVNPEVADYVRLIFTMKAEGIGLVAIADRLNEIGAPTPRGYKKSQGKYKNLESNNKWNYLNVRFLLKNRTYTGATVYNTFGKGEYKVIPNTHEALVDEATFEAISLDVEERGERKKKKTSSSNVLQGVFYCGDCGRAMFYDKVRCGTVIRNYRYHCGGYSLYRKGDEGAPPCGVTRKSISDHTVYKFVLDQIRTQLRAGLELEKLKQLMREDSKEKKKQTATITKREAEIKQKLRKLYEDYADKIITEDEYIEIRETYSEQLKAVQEELNSDKNLDSGTDSWAELKKKLFTDDFGGESVGTIQLSEHSSVEIIADDEADVVERLLCRGLTRELVETMVERLEYSVDGSFSIKFKCEDYVEKLLTMKGA
ncbi:MAG: recombinase family protein [Oscillospiraceae bacterium]|nr:recombinase family protein [Oscillospiraceae bacterium]